MNKKKIRLITIAPVSPFGPGRPAGPILPCKINCLRLDVTIFDETAHSLSVDIRYIAIYSQ